MLKVKHVFIVMMMLRTIFVWQNPLPKCSFSAASADDDFYGGPQLSWQIKIYRSKLEFTTANSNSLRQIQIHRSKFKFTPANSNIPHQIQIQDGKFIFVTWRIQRVESVDTGGEVRRGSEARRGWVRDSGSSINREIFNLTLLCKLFINEFKDFSA